jgi:hypothetical protein
MIIWVWFIAGAGGDGVANLLEHASNACTIDGNRYWRIHRYVDNKVKFYAPNLGKPQNTQRINTIDLLDDRQLRIANSDTEYLIVTSHVNPDLVSNNVAVDKNIKILVTSNNCLYNAYTKNLMEFDISDLEIATRQPNSNLADIVVDIDSMNDWEYTKKFTGDIGLNLAEKEFNHYRKIVAGDLIFDDPGIERYKTVTDADNIVRYSKLN